MVYDIKFVLQEVKWSHRIKLCLTYVWRMRICAQLGHISSPGASCTPQPVVVLGRRQQGLSTQEAQQGRKNQDIISEQGSHFLAAQLQNNTQVIFAGNFIKVQRSTCWAVLNKGVEPKEV